MFQQLNKTGNSSTTVYELCSKLRTTELYTLRVHLSQRFWNFCTVFVETCPLSSIHWAYTDLMFRVTPRSQQEKCTASFQKDVHHFTFAAVNIYGPHYDKGLFALKFHLLDRLHDEVTRFMSLGIIDASPSEHSVSTLITHRREPRNTGRVGWPKPFIACL